jgi:iron complex outermembrane receptor protein
VPETLRQGVEAQANLSMGPFSAYINYAYVDATYQFAGTLSSPFNPYANANGDIFVTPGDHIPGIPRQQLKVGGDYAFTPQFKAGFDVLIVGSQYYVGDDSNQNPQLPMYWVANLHASYQIADNVQFFGLINNLFNNHYATYGTFFDTGTDAQYAGNPVNFVSNPRTITPAQPIAFYGGVKVTF